MQFPYVIESLLFLKVAGYNSKNGKIPLRMNKWRETMYFVIDQDTIGRIRGVLEKQPDKPGNIRVYVAGMG